MEREVDRKIYFERWQSVKNAKVFEKNDKKGFAKNRFTKEDYKEVEEKTPVTEMKKVYEKLKQLVKYKEKDESER